MNKSIQNIQGSQLDYAQKTGITLAESFLDLEMVILLDVSGSMETKDAPGGKTRSEAAQEALTTIQGNNPGKVGLVCFADYTSYCSDGRIADCGSGTMLEKGLRELRELDDLGIKLVVVCDGEPLDKQKALNEAKKFSSPLNAIFIGPEDDLYGGRAFLQRLVDLSGGQFIQSDAPGMLQDGVERLLLVG